MSQQTAPVADTASLFSAVRHTDEKGAALDYIVDDVFPSKQGKGKAFVLIAVDSGKYRVDPLTDPAWTFA